MAVSKQVLHRKNSSGSYDEIHLRTNATVVNMSTTDTTKLSDKISTMNTAIAGKAAANHNHDGVYQPVGDYCKRQLGEGYRCRGSGAESIRSA